MIILPILPPLLPPGFHGLPADLAGEARQVTRDRIALIESRKRAYQLQLQGETECTDTIANLRAAVARCEESLAKLRKHLSEL